MCMGGTESEMERSLEGSLLVDLGAGSDRSEAGLRWVFLPSSWQKQEGPNLNLVLGPGAQVWDPSPQLVASL